MFKLELSTFSLANCLLVDKLLAEDPIFNRDDEYYLTRDEAFDRAMEYSLHYVQFCKEKKLEWAEKAMLNE